MLGVDLLLESWRVERAHAAFNESERRFRLAVEAARCGIWEWDLASGESADLNGDGANHSEVPGEVEIGYRLHPDYWNRGLITEAARVVRDHGFADLKLPRVISLVHPENIPSRRVAEKNGMRVEKEITFRGFPTLVYAITREQWLTNRDAS